MNITDCLNATLHTIAECNQAWVDNANYEATLTFLGFTGVVSLLLVVLVLVLYLCHKWGWEW
jgi:hypothetical protein